LLGRDAGMRTYSDQMSLPLNSSPSVADSRDSPLSLSVEVSSSRVKFNATQPRSALIQVVCTFLTQTFDEPIHSIPLRHPRMRSPTVEGWDDSPRHQLSV